MRTEENFKKGWKNIDTVIKTYVATKHDYPYI